MTRVTFLACCLALGFTACDDDDDNAVDAEVVADGSVRDGSVRDGSVRDGSVRDGSVSDGSASDGEVEDGSTTDGGLVSNTLGHKCVCDSDCEGDSSLGLTGACYFGVCVMTSSQICGSNELTSNGCPANGICIDISGDSKGYCWLKCDAEHSDDCEGECDSYQSCSPSNETANDCSQACSASCNHKYIDNCADYKSCKYRYDWLLEQCREKFPEEVEECIAYLTERDGVDCRLLDDSIRVNYEAMNDCVNQYCAAIQNDADYVDCLNEHCKTQTDACLPSVPGDGYCGPFENLETSEADCAACGDGICTADLENPGNCLIDCPSTCNNNGQCDVGEDHHNCSADCAEGSIPLGHLCSCDTDCAGDSSKGLSGACINGICTMSFTGTCSDANDHTHCPENTQCYAIDYSGKSYCWLDCRISGEECQGYCGDPGDETSQICNPTSATADHCVYECATACNRPLTEIEATSCEQYMDCLDRSYLGVTKDRCNKCDDNYYAWDFESVDACVAEYCVSCKTSDEIRNLYLPMAECWDEHNCDDAACRNQYCKTVSEACLPVDLNDGICGPLEDAVSSPADCHRCGDGVCSDGYEDTTNCLIDCNIVSNATCGAYDQCLTDVARCGNYCERYYDSFGFVSEAACQENYCKNCEAEPNIVAAYNAMTSCWSTSSCSRSNKVCVENHCKTQTDACLPSVDGDQYCGFFETLEENEGDCYKCGDDQCSEAFGETALNCLKDCAAIPPNATCDNASLPSEGPVSGYTYKAGHDYGKSWSDVFYKLVLDEQKTVTLTVKGDGTADQLIDTYLWLLKGDCAALTNAVVVAQNDNISAEDKGSSITKSLEAGTYYVVVESNRAVKKEGSFVLTLAVE